MHDWSINSLFKQSLNDVDPFFHRVWKKKTMASNTCFTADVLVMEPRQPIFCVHYEEAHWDRPGIDPYDLDNLGLPHNLRLMYSSHCLCDMCCHSMYLYFLVINIFKKKKKSQLMAT